MYVQSTRYYQFKVKTISESDDLDLLFSIGDGEDFNEEKHVFVEGEYIENVLFNDRETAVYYLEHFLEMEQSTYSYGEICPVYSRPKLKRIDDPKAKHERWIVGNFDAIIKLTRPNIKIV